MIVAQIGSDLTGQILIVKPEAYRENKHTSAMLQCNHLKNTQYISFLISSDRTLHICRLYDGLCKALEL